jgi:DNA polymerase-3 subunit delta
VDIQGLQRSLKKSRPAPVYLVAGEEDALVDKALHSIVARVLDSAAASDFARTNLDGRKSSAQEVEAAARTASLFGGRRLVILTDAQDLRPEEQKRLASYLEAPVETTTLVLVIRGAGAQTRDPKRSKAVASIKSLKKAVEKGRGVMVDCPRPKPRDLPRIAQQLLKDNGLSADSDGLYALVEAVGEDLGGLIQAVEKLSLYLGGKGNVTEREVAEVVADTRSQSIFALTDAAGEGAPDRALRVLGRMLRDGEHALAIIGHLARHFRNLALVQALDKRKNVKEEIHKALGLHPFVVKKCLLQLRRFSGESLERCLMLLADADLELKRGKLPQALVLEKLVMTLCEVG